MQTTQANGVAGASVALSRQLFFTICIACALSSPPVHAASVGSYTIRELPPPANQSYPYDINNRGDVVGETAGGPPEGFIYNAGTGGVRLLGPGAVTAINDRGEYVGISYLGGSTTGYVKREDGGVSLNYPSDCGPSGTYAWDINGSGTAVGHYFVCLSPGLFTWRGFRLIDDTPEDLNDTADLGSEASAINDLGHAVGYFQEIDDVFQTENAVKRAALFTGSTPQKIYSANVESVATDINNSGWIVGWWRELSMGDFAERPVHAFLRSNGGNQTLFEGIANAINNNGQVVGSKDTSSGQRAVRWQNGQLEILDDLLPVDSGWELQSADAINDKGEIVGYGLHNGEFRVFVLTPLFLGIDISESAGTPSASTWQAIKELGKEFVIVKGWGGTRNQFAQGQLAGARTANLLTAGYCLLNFRSDLSGDCQINEALLAFGTEARYLRFLAVDVEPHFLPSDYQTPKAQAKARERINDAVQQVRRSGLRPIIYTKANDWDPITGDWTHFSDLELWLVDYGNPTPDLPTVNFGGWTTSTGKQYVERTFLPGFPNMEVDLNVFDRTKFDLGNPNFSFPPPQLHLTSDNGRIALTWCGANVVLESSPNVLGPYTPTTEQSNPYEVHISGPTATPARFYRLNQQ